MSAVGSSRVATGVAGFFAAVVVEVLLAAVVAPALDPALLVAAEDFEAVVEVDLDVEDLLPTAVFPAAALVPLVVSGCF
jgi:hypothetical protein